MTPKPDGAPPSGAAPVPSVAFVASVPVHSGTGTAHGQSAGTDHVAPHDKNRLPLPPSPKTGSYPSNCVEGGAVPAGTGLERTLTPLRAVRAFCLWCCLDQPSEVRLCPAEKCPLWPLRLGRGTGRGGILKTIRARCLDCTGYEPGRVRSCPFDGAQDKLCPLWPFRFGHRPKNPEVQHA